MKPRALGPAACTGNLAPDILGYENPLSIMDLLFGKLVLMDYEAPSCATATRPPRRSPYWPSGSPVWRWTA